MSINPEGSDLKPVPDPTVLTTQQLLRELGSVREIIETRLDAMDKAISLIQAHSDKVPSLLDLAIEHLRTLHEEKFRSVQIQFQERDTRTEQTSRDSKVAVDAALQAAKEAVGEQNKSSSLAISKSEMATTKQIDQLVVLIQANAKASDEKIDDIKQRVTIIESHSKGVGDMWGYVVGFLGLVALVASAVGIAMTVVFMARPGH
jgi:hypothetical protein